LQEAHNRPIPDVDSTIGNIGSVTKIRMIIFAHMINSIHRLLVKLNNNPTQIIINELNSRWIIVANRNIFVLDPTPVSPVKCLVIMIMLEVKPTSFLQKTEPNDCLLLLI